MRLVEPPLTPFLLCRLMASSSKLDASLVSERIRSLPDYLLVCCVPDLVIIIRTLVSCTYTTCQKKKG